MKLNPRTIKLSLVAATAAAALAGAQTAQADVTCVEGGHVLTVTLTEHGDTARLYGGGTIFVDEGPKPLSCAGNLDTNFVDAILINDLADDLSTAAAYDGATTVVIDEPVTFAPGYTPEGAYASEIEFFADLKGGED